jgi:hypothetical protein
MNCCKSIEKEADMAVELDKSREFVIFSLDAAPDVIVKMDAAEVDRLIKNLGDRRQLMAPGVPEKFDRTQARPAPLYPAFELDQERATGAIALTWRDPRFGWQSYMVSKENAKALGQALTNLTKGH